MVFAEPPLETAMGGWQCCRCCCCCCCSRRPQLHSARHPASSQTSVPGWPLLNLRATTFFSAELPSPYTATSRNKC
jgi:hypothetical protein